MYSQLFEKKLVFLRVRTVVVWITALALLLAISLLFEPYGQLLTLYVFVNLIFGISLNVLLGFTGQLSLGQAGFMAIGAYTFAACSRWVSPESIPMFFCLQVLSGLVTVFFGFLVGLPSLRLKGDYLAIVTLGFGEVIRVLLLNQEWLGGARGFYGVAQPEGFLAQGTLAVIWVLISLFIVFRLRYSSWGQRFLAIREDELAARFLGFSVFTTKIWAFLISSFFAGISGSLFAMVTSYLNPATFQFQKSVEALIIVVLGGVGSVSGLVIASCFVTLLPEFLRPLQDWLGVDIRMLLYSLLLIGVMIGRPQGILGFREIDRFSHFFRADSNLKRKYE